MATIFVWSGNAKVGTTYGYTRQFNPQTGGVVMRGTSWAAGAPAMELVLRTLRTPKGRYLLDKDFGLDYAKFQKLFPGADARCQTAIEDALAWLVKGKIIEKLKVKVEVSRGQCRVDVSFYDLRSRAFHQVTGATQ